MTITSDKSILYAADAVAAFIELADHTYLLLKRDDKEGVWYPDHWGLFGGAVEDNETLETWLVESGGWVSRLDPSTGTYKGTYGHIKNLLQFLEGSKPMWYDPDRLEKRSYVRRKVHRGIV